MSSVLDYDEHKSLLFNLNTDDTLSSAHGILCGFACVKPEIQLDDWLGEVLVSIDLNNINEKVAHETLAKIFNETLSGLSDPTLNFSLLIADEQARLGEQADTLIQWCQGFLVGLGLQKISTHDEEVLEMIKDFSEISKLDTSLIEDDQNAQDLAEIVEFVRMGVLFIQESLQPSKQDYISPETLH